MNSRADGAQVDAAPHDELTAHEAAPVDTSGPARMLRLERTKRPITSVAVLFIGLIAIALVSLEAWTRFSAREHSLAESRVATANIARATAYHAHNTLDLADAILWGLVERVEHDGTTATTLPRLHGFLRMQVARTPALHGLFVYDEHGRWIVNSLPSPITNINNSDREYFIYHQANPSREAHVGKPVQSRSTGAWVLPLSRRLQHPDGSFAGVALASIRIDFFQAFFDSFNIGNKGSIFMALDSGTLVSRRPYKAGLIGSDISQGPVFQLMQQTGPSGSALLMPKLDNVERMYSYRHVQAFPLVVGAALAKDEILKQWTSNTVFEGGAIVVLLTIVLYVGAKLYRQFLIRDRLEHELRGVHQALETSNAALIQLAMKDGLTGLSNRRHLDEQMRTEFGRAMRKQSSLALVLIDVDHFKLYNDTYGHSAGDACLQAVSQAVAGARKRPGDVAARFGGEEFAILLPDTNADGAVAVANEACQAINAMAMCHAGSAAGTVTISAGVFALVPGQGQTIPMLIEAADRGLYRAKSAGRNQVAMGQLELGGGTGSPSKEKKLT